MKVYSTLGDGIDALRPDERPDPTPGPTEVVVRMRAATLNYRDLLVVRGEGFWKPGEPRIPVSDGVGTVVAAGERVSRVVPGDRVAGAFLPGWIDGELTAEKGAVSLGGAGTDGVLAELRRFDEQAVVRVPEHLSDVEAATLPVAAITAWHAVRRRSDVRAGESVLIQGTGGVSLAALQFAAALGAEPIVLSSSAEKLARARELGARHGIDYREAPDWEARVLDITGGRGVDHVIEVVGGENLNRSFRVLRVGGTISFIGLMAGLSGEIDTWQLVAKNARVHGIETGSRAMFEEMNAFIAAHQIRPVVDRVFGFDEARAALRHLESGAHVGKVGIRFG